MGLKIWLPLNDTTGNVVNQGTEDIDFIVGSGCPRYGTKTNLLSNKLTNTDVYLSTSSGSASNSSCSTNFTYTRTKQQDDSYSVKVTAPAGTYSWGVVCLANSTNLKPSQLKTNTKYCLSFEIKTTLSATISASIRNGDGTNLMTNAAYFTLTGDSKWHKYEVCLTTISSFSSITVGSQFIYLGSMCNSSGCNHEFRHIKLETGGYSTEWTCSDITANGRNHLSTGKISRYSYCFDETLTQSGGSYIINKSTNSTATQYYGSTNGMSFGAWIKNRTFTASTNMAILGNRARNSGFGLTATGATTINVRYAGVEIAVPVTANKWTHVIGTVNGSTLSAYKNGVLVGTAEITGSPSYMYSSGFSIGDDYAQGTHGSGFSGSLNDVRVYDHCLSTKEIQELAKGLMIHFKLDSISDMDDCSGYQNANLNQLSTANGYSESARYEFSVKGKLQAPLKINLEEFTLSTWVLAETGISLTTFLLGSFSSWTYDGIGIWASATQATSRAYSFLLRSNTEDNYKSWSNAFSFTSGDWTHIAIVYNGTTIKTYKNGSLLTTQTYGNNGSCFFANICLLSSLYNSAAENASMSDFRLYSTALSDSDVANIKNVSASIDNSGKVFAHDLEFSATSKPRIFQDGRILGTAMNELCYAWITNSGETLRTESDGSVWMRVFHHNNPASYLFRTTDNFTKPFRIDSSRYWNMPACNDILRKSGNNFAWEFLVVQRPVSGGTITTYRWIQTKNPYEAVFEDVDAADVTKVSGYTNVASYGGFYLFNDSHTYMVANNGTKGNWFGALGALQNHNGGIPGYGGVTVTTGYLDVYLRVDGALPNDFTANLWSAGVNSNQFIEW